MFYLRKSAWLGLHKQVQTSDSSGVVIGCGWCRCVARVCEFGSLYVCVSVHAWLCVCVRGDCNWVMISGVFGVWR